MLLHTKNKLLGLSLIACLGLMTSAQAGVITTQPQAAPSPSTPGYNGLNLGNIDVFITDLEFNPIAGKNFNEADGSYTAMVVGDTFESQVTDNTGKVMGKLHGKNWPVGEPMGVKVINNDPGNLQNGKPENCIMTTSYLEGSYLDSSDPVFTTCSSSFQTHKRFKVNLQPNTVAGGEGAEEGFDLVFNVADQAGMKRYQVFQKINNYTGKRLVGYTAQVGFGVGETFIPATPSNDLNISLGILENDTTDPISNIWDVNEMANFAHGLWGPIDNHFPTPGFFDSIRAGFEVTLDTDNKITTSGATLGSNYVSLFGSWLTNQWAPSGIFYDFDDDPTTDADLVAFWADYDKDGVYEWTSGQAGGFAPIGEATLAAWSVDRLYSVGKIEDVLNLGLNYIINVGNISTFDDYNSSGDATATFTIRITPKLADQSVPANTDVPGWITNPPVLGNASSQGSISISTDPFTVGDELTVIVEDSDLNEDNATVETVDINVTNDLGEVEWVTLTELTSASGVFRGILDTNNTTDAGTDNDGILNVTEGSIVTATYLDANSSDGINVLRVDTATAIEPVTPSVTPPVNNDTSKGIFSTMDNVSLFAMIFGFLVLGGLIARRKLAKS